MKKIVVIGSSNTDMVVKTNRFPNPGETILGGDFFMFPGGKGANQAVAAARMGGEVTFICKTGNDVFGKKAIAGFKEEGINTDYITTDEDKASGTALILVNAKGENEIVVAPGANNTLSETDILKAEDSIRDADIILLQLEIPLSSILAAAKKGFELRKKVILNPAPASSLPDELFSYLYLITPNETEAELLTGVKPTDINSVGQAADVLLSKGVKNVIITMGAAGAYFKNATDSLFVAAPKVEAVDTTAAGDIFNGALAVELSSGKGWEPSIKTACRAAAISVTRMGAQASAPFSYELEGALAAESII
jgi:ribokinase